MVMAASPVPTGFQQFAPKRRITVTQEDINQSTKSDSKRCAIARAIAHSFPQASHIVVDVASIRFSEADKRYVYFTPDDAQRLILTFDLGGTVEPTALTLKSGMVHDIIRRPGVGGRPSGSRIASAKRAPKRVNSNAGRRTYGARSMTSISTAASRAVAKTP